MIEAARADKLPAMERVAFIDPSTTMDFFAGVQKERVIFKMEIHFIRNATLIIKSGDQQILVDPMLGRQGSLPLRGCY